MNKTGKIEKDIWVAGYFMPYEGYMVEYFSSRGAAEEWLAYESKYQEPGTDSFVALKK